MEFKINSATFCMRVAQRTQLASQWLWATCEHADFTWRRSGGWLGEMGKEQIPSGSAVICTPMPQPSRRVQRVGMTGLKGDAIGVACLAHCQVNLFLVYFILFLSKKWIICQECEIIPVVQCSQFQFRPGFKSWGLSFVSLLYRKKCRLDNNCNFAFFCYHVVSTFTCT